MSKQKIELTKDRIDLLNRVILKKNYKSSPRAKRKAKVILLKSEGKSIKEITDETKLSKRTIISYVKEYSNPNKNIGGMRFIHKNQYKKSSLNIIDSELENPIIMEFSHNTPISYKEATQRIKKLFNISLSESAVRRFLRNHKIYTKRSKRPIYSLENK